MNTNYGERMEGATCVRVATYLATQKESQQVLTQTENKDLPETDG